MNGWILMVGFVAIAPEWLGGNSVAPMTKVGKYPTEDACEREADKHRHVERLELNVPFSESKDRGYFAEVAKCFRAPDEESPRGSGGVPFEARP